ncbi:MAG: hypothetical protein ABR953_14400 [Candidatus Acidiferrales bacterium]|jgi:hypothetical protein
MNEVGKVLNRYIVKNEEQPQDHARIARELGEIANEVAESAKRRLMWAQVRLEVSLLNLEVKLLLLALGERARLEPQEGKIESVADLEAALRGQLH